MEVERWGRNEEDGREAISEKKRQHNRELPCEGLISRGIHDGVIQEQAGAALWGSQQPRCYPN